MTTKGVMEVNRYDTSIYYQVACDCGDPDCNMILELEYDKKLNMLVLNLYKKVSFSVYWQDNNWFKALWRKMKYALQILFKGYIQLEECHIFKDEEHIQNFIHAIRDGREKILSARIPQDTDDLQERSLDEI